MQGHSVTTVIFLSGSVILLKPVHAETMWCWFTLDVFLSFYITYLKGTILQLIQKLQKKVNFAGGCMIEIEFLVFYLQVISFPSETALSRDAYQENFYSVDSWSS